MVASSGAFFGNSPPEITRSIIISLSSGRESRLSKVFLSIFNGVTSHRGLHSANGILRTVYVPVLKNGTNILKFGVNSVMKILVFSDSHGNTSRMKEAISDHLPSCAMIIHLGDGVRDIEYVSSFYPELPVVSLKGNGESFFRDERVFDEGGVRFMCIHGHSYGVKSSLDRAVYAAEENGADILLYGHTHVAKDTVINLESGKSIRVFNPGSVGRGYPSSYGIIEIDKRGNILTSHRTF